ncbi:MAG TPA: cell division protein SepF [Candidatus Bathyarchaeia archaeon]
MPLNLFRKKKKTEQEKPAVPPQEEPKIEAPTPIQTETTQEPITPVPETIEEPLVTTPELPKEAPSIVQEQPQENIAPPVEQKQEIAQPPVEQKPEAPSKTYLKAMPLRDLSDIENIKSEVKNGNIIILRVTPLASKSIEDVKTAVNDLYEFSDSIGGDIARLGEERVVICPKTIRIWREKSPAPVSSGTLPTSA